MHATNFRNQHACQGRKPGLIVGLKVMIRLQLMAYIIALSFDHYAFAQANQGASKKDHSLPTLDQIIESRSEISAKVNRLKITLRRNVPQLGIVDSPQTIAWDGRKRHFEETRSNQGGTWTGSGTPSPQVQALMEAYERGKTKESRAFDGSNLYVMHGNTGEVNKITDLSKKPNTSLFDFAYLFSSGWFIKDPSATKDINSMLEKNSIFSRFQTGSHWTIREESLDGVTCVRLDGEIPGAKNVLWLDPERNYAMVKGEGFLASSGKLFSRATCSEFEKVAEGVWLPKKVHTEEYVPPPGVKEDRVVYDYEVTSIDLTPQPDDFFVIRFPGGTALSESINSQRTKDGPTIVAAGPGDLDASVNAVKRWSRSAKLTLLLVVNLVVICGTLGYWVYWRRTRKTN